MNFHFRLRKTQTVDHVLQEEKMNNLHKIDIKNALVLREARECKSCFELKDIQMFPFGDKEKKYRKHICNNCQAVMRSHREKLLKANSNPELYLECGGDCGQVWAKRLGSFCRRCGSKGISCGE